MILLLVITEDNCLRLVIALLAPGATGISYEHFMHCISMQNQSLICRSFVDVMITNFMICLRCYIVSFLQIEEKHRGLCRLVIQFNPPTTPPKLPGSVFRNFLRSFLVKNRGADRNLPPPGVSSNSVFVSLYTVVLHFLSEGFSLGEESCCIKANDVGFLHRGGQRNFPVDLFLKHDPPGDDVSRLGGSFSHLLKSHAVDDLGIEVIQWEEGCMDDEETRVTHLSSQKPCCCSDYVGDFMRNSKDPIKYSGRSFRGHVNTIPECSSHDSAGCSTGSLNEEIEDKPSSSDQPEHETGYREVHHSRFLPKEIDLPSATLREEELLDTMLRLYHIGLAPNFKQVRM